MIEVEHLRKSFNEKEAENEVNTLYRFYFEQDVESKSVEAIPGVHVLSFENGRFHCRLDTISPNKAIAAMINKGLSLSEVIKENENLEKIYLRYTGGAS